jgi:integrase
MKITDTIIKSIIVDAGKRVELRDDVEPGLILRITDSGVRTWSVRYRNNAGEQRRKTLGKYPAIGLARARDDARKIKGQLAHGEDVVAIAKAKKAEERRMKLSTLSGLADAYFLACEEGSHRGGSKATPKRASTIKGEKQVFKNLVEPKFGKVPVGKITRIEIRDFVSTQAKSSPSNGRHVRNIIRQLLSFAMTMDLIDSNPAMSISAPISAPRERVLTEDEIKAFWLACERPEEVEGLALPKHMGIALRLAAVTLQRRGEIMGAHWSEIDLKSKLWVIPAIRMKGKKTHAVPLSDLAMSILQEAKDKIGGNGFVFQAPRLDEPAPMDSHFLSKGMKAIVDTLKMDTATPHDLRRTGATMMTGECVGIPRFIVSQVLAHASDTGGAAAVTGMHYDLNDYLPDKRRALDAWAALLIEITSGQKRESNVRSIKAKRA